MQTDLLGVEVKDLKTVEGRGAGEGDIRLAYTEKLVKTREKITTTHLSRIPFPDRLSRARESVLVICEYSLPTIR